MKFNPLVLIAAAALPSAFAAPAQFGERDLAIADRGTIDLKERDLLQVRATSAKTTSVTKTTTTTQKTPSTTSKAATTTVKTTSTSKAAPSTTAVSSVPTTTRLAAAATTTSAGSSALTCGVAGYDKTASYSYDGTAADATFAVCSAKCNADSACLSFAFGSSACLLYSVAAGSNVNAMAGSPYTFYDKGCSAGSVSTPTTTTTSAVLTSSTTTSSVSGITSTTSGAVTTTSGTAITSAASTTSSSAQAAPTCAVAGYDKGTASYYYDGVAADATFAACSAKCQADAACGSFAIGGGACLLYAPSLATNLNPVAGSAYTFYDRACTSATPTTTSSTSAALTTTTTTTTLVITTSITSSSTSSSTSATSISTSSTGISSSTTTSTTSTTTISSTSTTTSTTTTSQVCIPTATAAASPPSGSTCGSSTSGAPNQGYAQDFSADNGDCAAICLADSRCMAFATAPDTSGQFQMCDLFGSAVSAIGINSYGTYTFFDKACFIASQYCYTDTSSKFRKLRRSADLPLKVTKHY